MPPADKEGECVPVATAGSRGMEEMRGKGCLCVHSSHGRLEAENGREGQLKQAGEGEEGRAWWEPQSI